MKYECPWKFVAGLVGAVFFFITNSASASHMGTSGEGAHEQQRPLYVYPGNYRDEVNRLKEKFKQAFGYELMGLDEEWRPEEIERLHSAFARLPDNFYRIAEFKGFYRASRLNIAGAGPEAPEAPDASGIPAATFPSFSTVYRHAHKSYRVILADEPLRIEFYNAIFYEGAEDFENIVHHEMAHVYDLSHGFLTFQNNWLALARFHVLHLPALDGKLDSDFLYTLVSDPDVLNYGPVSGRHLPTYSRENPQEDFANSAAAYIHYPFFKFTHPARYQYMKEHVFDGREYFKESKDKGDYASTMASNLHAALTRSDWNEVVRLSREQSRYLNEAVEKKWVDALRQAVDQTISSEADLNLAIASCYLVHPEAMVIRRDLEAARRIQLAKLFRDSRCSRMGRQAFEGGQAKWALTHLYFYREKGRAKVQFLDPVALTAYSRGWETRYRWKLSVTSPRTRVISQGEAVGSKKPNGAFAIDLESTAQGRYVLPEGRELILEVSAVRAPRGKGNPLESPRSPLKFVVQSGFNYLGPEQISFQVRFPPSWKSNP